MRLVISLYEGAIDAVSRARENLRQCDIEARTRHINKAVQILTELLGSLDHEKGREVSANLSRLYGYMIGKLVEANVRQSAEALNEVETLLKNLLEAWRVVAEKTDCEPVFEPRKPQRCECEESFELESTLCEVF